MGVSPDGVLFTISKDGLLGGTATGFRVGFCKGGLLVALEGVFAVSGDIYSKGDTMGLTG